MIKELLINFGVGLAILAAGTVVSVLITLASALINRLPAFPRIPFPTICPPKWLVVSFWVVIVICAVTGLGAIMRQA